MKWNTKHTNDGIGNKISYYWSECGRFYIHATPRGVTTHKNIHKTHSALRIYRVTDKELGKDASFGKLADAKKWCEEQPNG